MFFALTLIVVLALLFVRAKLWQWTTVTFIALLLYTKFSSVSFAWLCFVWMIFWIAAILLNLRGLRRSLITHHVLKIYRQIMPRMSDTEKEAINAGTVSFEAEIFRGAIDWRKFLNTPTAKLTAAEQSFLDGPVTKLCAMIDDWDITHNRHDMSPEMWAMIKQEGFFGLMIPTEFGGKGFTALAQSEILSRVYSRSTTVASTIAVPNSLGPAELLLHYGTEEQKNYYLPRLARGEEIPCFALTGPDAGSDAGAMPDTGIICRGQWQGQEIVGIKLNWNKRYITLSPVATVLGLAFKLYDPDHLLSETTDRGITCALIPVNTAGVTTGRRHFPLNIPFQNGPTQGNDVFVPLDYIIGGEAMIGAGWRMLVECLSAGRAITLPTSAISGMKMLSVVTGAYARIRHQFNTAIGNFEGIQFPLARIVGHTYSLNAARLFALTTIDNGGKPSVVSAIMKYHATEAGRQAICDAMDIHGGKGICLGPHNYLGRFYEGAPISITVEGANILTRSMIIFGQGAIRCHPYALAELQAAQLVDKKASLRAFDRALFSHLGYSLSNFSRSLCLSLSNGRLWLHSPINTSAKHYLEQANRWSANFALMADVCMLSIGAELKRKEGISARLGDMLSKLYILSATIKTFQENGANEEEKPLLDYACQSLLFDTQKAAYDVINNLPHRWLRILLRIFVFPLGRPCQEPSDKLADQVAELVMKPSDTRNRLAEGIDWHESSHNAITLLDKTLRAVLSTDLLEKRIRKAARDGQVQGRKWLEQIDNALVQALITPEEAQLLRETDRLRYQVINVDDFASEEL